MRLVPTSEGRSTPDRPGPSATEDPTVAQSSTGSDEQPRRSSPISRPQMIIATVVVVLLAGVLTVLLTRGSSHRTAQPSPTPDINGLITKVPAIYPIVQAQLATQRLPLSLLPDANANCIRAGYSTSLPDSQWCRWAPATLGKTQDETLNVIIDALTGVSQARTDLMSAAKAPMGYFAPTVIERTSVAGLGDEALVGRALHVIGAFRKANMNMSGAEVSVRVRNVVVAVVWGGANYTLNPSGTTALNMVGFSYPKAEAEAISIAKVVASRIS